VAEKANAKLQSRDRGKFSSFCNHGKTRLIIHVIIGVTYMLGVANEHLDGPVIENSFTLAGARDSQPTPMVHENCEMEKV
jgi:hypothetical protein